jgi:hypothetical protein
VIAFVGCWQEYLGLMKNGLLSLVELAFGMQRLSSFDDFFLGNNSFFFLCGTLIFA